MARRQPQSRKGLNPVATELAETASEMTAAMEFPSRAYLSVGYDIPAGGLRSVSSGAEGLLSEHAATPIPMATQRAVTLILSITQGRHDGLRPPTKITRGVPPSDGT